jgi:hypothetical protein
MIHQQAGTDPSWLATMTMCGKGVKADDTLTLDPDEVECSSCLNQLRRRPEAPPE